MNKVFLMGRLTREPEIRYGQSGNAIAKYAIAVDRRYKQNGEKVYATDIVTNSVEFAESKAANERNAGGRNDDDGRSQTDEDGFMPMDDDEELLPI